MAWLTLAVTSVVGFTVSLEITVIVFARPDGVWGSSPRCLGRILAR